jgi:Fur family ferric uptake transcriptional regulator
MGTKEIKRAGLKVTLPRVRIIEILETNKSHHMSAEDVYRTLLDDKSEDSSIALATVYRVLTQFEKAGLIIRHNFEGGQAVFELDKGEHHDHLVCLTTGKIVEFHDEIIEQRQREIAEEHGFLLADHSLTLYGEFKK